MGGGSSGEELRLLRAEVAALAAALDALPPPDPLGGVTVACKTVSGGAYPTGGAVGKTFLVQPLDIFGAETEGAVVTTTPRPGSFPAANLLAGLPPVGTEVSVHVTTSGAVFSYG